jgi:hypothetical protein
MWCPSCNSGPDASGRCRCQYFPRVLKRGEVYCVACDSAPCVCGQDHVHDGRLWRYCNDCAAFNHRKKACPKCGQVNACVCYFTQEELDYYAGHPGPVFPARFTSRCKRCTVIITEGESAQMINGLFGHPFQTCPTEKETTVSEIKSVISATERRLGELYAERDAQESWGKDSDYPNETVLWFKQAYNGSHQYDYTAAKIRPNTWYLTGKWSVAMGFDQLVREHLMKADEVWIVSAWEKISG